MKQIYLEVIYLKSFRFSYNYFEVIFIQSKSIELKDYLKIIPRRFKNNILKIRYLNIIHQIFEIKNS